MTSEEVDNRPANVLNVLLSHLSDYGGGNLIFKDRGIALTSSVYHALKEYEQQGKLTISIDEIINNLSLEKVVTMQRDDENLTPETRHRLLRYLKNTGPYDENRPFEELDQELAKQHGFGQSYVIRTVSYMVEACN